MLLRFPLGWLGTFYYPAQLYLLCIVFIFFLTTHYFWGIKGTRAGWQVHLDSGPMPQGEKEQHFILIIYNKQFVLFLDLRIHIVSFFHVIFPSFIMYYNLIFANFKMIEVLFLWAEL